MTSVPRSLGITAPRMVERVLCVSKLLQAPRALSFSGASRLLLKGHFISFGILFLLYRLIEIMWLSSHRWLSGLSSAIFTM